MLSLGDRMALSILTKPIRTGSELSDTSTSLLRGLAFLSFYSVAGLLLGIFADQVSRVRLVCTGLIVWYLATCACGLATGVGFLFAARMLVWIGEVTLSPAAYWLITGSFPRSWMGLALGVYSLGGAVGAGAALLVGGVSTLALQRCSAIRRGNTPFCASPARVPARRHIPVPKGAGAPWNRRCSAAAVDRPFYRENRAYALSIICITPLRSPRRSPRPLG